MTESISIVITILTSAVGVAAWITTRLARIETEIKHAFLRITALEESSRIASKPRRRRKRTS